MTDCDRLSDRMPEVAHGLAAWDADEAWHLTQCDACRLEWELVQRTQQLGAHLKIDEAMVADAVLPRVPARHPNTRRRVWTVAALAAAASVVLVLWGGASLRRQRVARPPAESIPVTMAAPTPTETAELELSLPELDDLDTNELETLLDTAKEPFNVNELLDSSSWGDLEGRELEPAFSIGGG